MPKTRGYSVVIDVFIPIGDIQESKEGTLNTNEEIARILAEEMADGYGYGYHVKQIVKVK